MVDHVVSGGQFTSIGSIRQQVLEKVVTSIVEKMELARLDKSAVVIAECRSPVGISSEVGGGGHNKKASRTLLTG